MSRLSLKIVFGAILILMLLTTGWASFQESIFAGGPKVLQEPWSLATLADAYCGFLTFYAWVFYKESHWFARLAWLFLILSLGNIAMSIYVLIQVFRLPPRAPIENILLRSPRVHA